MNKDNAHLYLPLVQALADGKLQIRRGNSWDDATGNQEFSFFMSPEDYRIKPEPRELWIVIDKRYESLTEDEARKTAECNDNFEAVHVREVLP